MDVVRYDNTDLFGQGDLYRSSRYGLVRVSAMPITHALRALERLRRELGEDVRLASWRLASGRPGDDELVFPGHDRALWGADDWKNWRNRTFRPAAKAIGLPVDTRPYDLRHSFVSLLLAEGRSAIYVAKQAGHSPTMTLDTYGHVIDELETAENVSAEEAIRLARRSMDGHPAIPSESTIGHIGSSIADGTADHG